MIVDSAADELDLDYGPGDLSLREAVGLANGSVGTEVIGFGFEQPETIKLLMGELAINDSVTIDGPGAGNLTIDGQRLSRVFNVDDRRPEYLDVVMNDLTVTGGFATGSGGGIHNLENLTIRQSTISGNSTQFSGGGIYHRFGRLELNRSSVAGNYASWRGGGIFSDTDLTGVQLTSVTQSTISGNTALAQGIGGGGGGIYNVDGVMEIYNSTVAYNYAPYPTGAGIASYGDYLTQTRLYSTICSGNFRTDVAYVTGSVNSFASYGYNLVGYGNATGNFFPGGTDQVGVSTPGLGPLTLNGGPTATHPVLGSSPARNRGAVGSGVSADQRGAPFNRDDGDGVDVGAFERQTAAGLPDPLIVDTAVDDLDGDYSLGDLSLREAIGLANGSVGFNAIVFDTGNVFSVPQVIPLNRGQLLIRDSVLVEGPSPELVTVDGQGLSRILHIRRGDADPINVTLAGLTLTGGNSVLEGGAINTAEALAIVDSRITGNTAFLEGGGIIAYNSLRVIESTISDNSTYFFGGGLAHIGVYPLEVVGSTVRDNIAYLYGGGISNWGEAIITGSTISHNVSYASGGGISNLRTLILDNSTVSGNSAAIQGGGIYTRNLSGFVTSIQNSTITSNEAPAGYGSGVASRGDTDTMTHVASTIIAANANSDVDIVAGGTNSMISGGYNVVGSGNAVAAFMNNDQPNVADPGLDLLANNGGPNHTHALLPGSTAIDRGDPGLANPPDFDQRGEPFARVYNNRIDVGAFEWIDGDFDGSDSYECADVNALVATIVAGTHVPLYDLNSDSLVTVADLDTWLAVAGVANLPSHRPYLKGDANLDGFVDGQDFIIWNANKFQVIAAWCAGDFTADGVVDGQDFIVWNANKFQSALAPRWMSSAVHEGSVPPRDVPVVSLAASTLVPVCHHVNAGQPLQRLSPSLVDVLFRGSESSDQNNEIIESVFASWQLQHARWKWM